MDPLRASFSKSDTLRLVIDTAFQQVSGCNTGFFECLDTSAMPILARVCVPSDSHCTVGTCAAWQTIVAARKQPSRRSGARGVARCMAACPPVLDPRKGKPGLRLQLAGDGKRTGWRRRLESL